MGEHNTSSQKRLIKAVKAHYDVDEVVTEADLEETIEWVYERLLERNAIKEIHPMGMVFVKTQLEEFFAL